MILQIIAAKKKQLSETNRSMGLNVIDMTPDHQRIPDKKRDWRVKPGTSSSRRKSLFEIYKQNHKRQRKHKFSRVETEGGHETTDAEPMNNISWSSQKLSRHSPTRNRMGESLMKQSPLHKEAIACTHTIEGRFERIRRRILATKIPCIQVRKLNRSDIEFHEPLQSWVNSTEGKSHTKKPPVVGHFTSAKFMRSTVRQKSPQLTPWYLPQTRSRLFDCNEFDD